MNPDEFIPTRRSLLTRLRQWDDQESWNTFFDTYWKLLYSVALKSGLSQAEAQDVVQESIVAVAKKMPQFRYDPSVGSFKAWLLIIVRRRIADHLRKQYRRVPIVAATGEDEPGTSTIDRVPNPMLSAIDQVWDEEWEKHLMETASARAKRQINPRQWQIFDCHVLKGWPVGKVTKTLGVNIGQVYLAKHRVSRVVKREIENVKKTML